MEMLSKEELQKLAKSYQDEIARQEMSLKVIKYLNWQICQTIDSLED